MPQATEGWGELQAKLKRLVGMGKEASGVSVLVGYTQAYALFVHENLEAHHPVGQAKFLEQPAREHRPTMAAIVKDALKRGVPPAKALVMAGLFLQARSQELCPVDTGALKASAFTRLEE